jgi:hypothetical protein
VVVEIILVVFIVFVLVVFVIEFRRRLLRWWWSFGELVRLAIAVASAALAGCSYLPAAQERARTASILSGIDHVVMAEVECGSRVFAGDELCADVMMKDGAKIHFARLGFNSFGSTAVNVVVERAGNLEPRVASCNGTAPPNFHRLSALGHHFHPTLIDVKDAVARYREVMEEVQWWPQCPQFWEVADRRGVSYRYCARRAGATDEPPRPPDCR